MSKNSLIAGLLISASFSVMAAEHASFVLSHHQHSLKRFLDRNPHFSVAPDSLCQCESTLVDFRKREPQFQPYYAVGDINDDGIEDFAVGLMDARKSTPKHPLLTLVIFHGPFSNKGLSKRFTILRDYPVSRPREVLYVFKARVENGHRFRARLDLGPGPFGSDDNWFISYNWRLGRYEVH